MLSGLLVEFDCLQSVPNDVGVDQLYLPPHSYSTQENINQISAWTDSNLMRINTKKSNYIIFTRSKANFGTRLTLNDQLLDRVEEIKVVGVWLQSDLKWAKNTKEHDNNVEVCWCGERRLNRYLYLVHQKCA